jgi:threonine dehydratase
VTAAVDEMITVTENALLAAMRLMIENAGLLAEPSGAAGIAALMEHGERFRGAEVAVVITGSNLDPRLLPRLAA